MNKGDRQRVEEIASASCEEAMLTWLRPPQRYLPLCQILVSR